MKLSELIKLVERHGNLEGHRDPDLVIKIKLPYNTVGRLPSVPVVGVQMGFDWEAGQFIITPGEELTPSDRDFAKQMTDMQERAARADYENRNLKAEIRQLKKKLTTQ